MTDDILEKITHFNIPQQKNWIVNANTSVAVIGRAGGKDHGFVSPTIIRNASGMPRGATAFITPTYIKAKSDMIPALTKALEKFNLYEEVDYWVGRFIPSHIKHEKAFEHPREAEYSIFFRNGHVIRIIGLDNKKTANGQSNDFLILNEARFIAYEDFISRVKPTNRGNEDTFFNQLHYHHGSLITTDMPRTAGSKWILEYEKRVDQEQIDLIVSFDYEQREYLKYAEVELRAIDPTLPAMIRHDQGMLKEVLKELVDKNRLTTALDKRIRKELHRLDDILFQLRRKAVYFIRASTLDNLDAVQPNFIDEMFRDLSEKEFNTSILNIEDDSPDDPFYSTFNDELHCYDDINYGYVELFENLEEMPKPYKKDNDVDPSRALSLACDFNKAMTCLVVGQEFRHVFKVLNALYVKDPERIKHLAELFNKYYEDFPTRIIHFYFDHTATGMDASREQTFAEELHYELSKLGWRVVDHYIGKTSSHRSRHKLFKRVFAEDDPDTKKVRINRHNCKDNLVISLSNCGSYEDKDGFAHKDKSPETKKPGQKGYVIPEHAPHLSDAFDTLYIGVFQDRIGEADFEPDVTT